jgi:hypothetical protein
MVTKWRHYFEIYERHFAQYRGHPVRLVEFGVWHGGSLQLWRKYLGPAAHIVGWIATKRAPRSPSPGPTSSSATNPTPHAPRAARALRQLRHRDRRTAATAWMNRSPRSASSIRPERGRRLPRGGRAHQLPRALGRRPQAPRNLRGVRQAAGRPAARVARAGPRAAARLRDADGVRAALLPRDLRGGEAAHEHPTRSTPARRPCP